MINVRLILKKLIILLFFFPSVLLSSDILINTKPNPVQSGEQLRISLAADLPINKVYAELQSGKKIALTAINESLFTGNYIIPSSTKPGVYTLTVVVELSSGQSANLNTTYQVVSAQTVDSLGVNIETSEQSKIKRSEQADLQLKIDQLENNMDSMQQEKNKLQNQIDRLKDDIDKLKQNQEDEKKRQEKEKELKKLQEELNRQNEDIQNKMNDLKNRMKELNSKQNSLNIKRSTLFKLESKIRNRESEIRKKEFDLKAQEVQLGLQSSEIQDKQAELLSKEVQLKELESEIESKNIELQIRQESLDSRSEDLQKNQEVLETQRKTILAKESYLEEVSDEITVKRKELVDLSLNLAARQSELNKLRLSHEQKTNEEMMLIERKETELDSMQQLLTQSKDALIQLEQDQKAEKDQLRNRREQLRLSEQKLSNMEANLEAERDALSQLEQEILYKYELLRALNFWIQSQISLLKEEYLKSNNQQDAYLDEFDFRFKRLEKLSRLLERRAYRLNQLNTKLSKENYILSQKLDEKLKPDYRFYISPFLGVKMSKNSDELSGASQYGLRGGIQSGSRFAVETGIAYLSYSTRKNTSDTKNESGLKYLLGGTYDLNPGEYSVVFLSAGFMGGLGSSNYDMEGYAGLGVKLDYTEYLKTRFDVQFSDDVFFGLSAQKLIVPIAKQQKDIDKTDLVLREESSRLSPADEVDIELVIDVPEKQEFYLPQKENYVDIENHWARYNIEQMSALHFVDGVKEDQEMYFLPNGSMGEADVIKALVLAYYSTDFLSQIRIPVSYSFIGKRGTEYYVSVKILDQKGKLITELQSYKPMLNEKDVVYWNGKQSDGQYVKEGRYKVSVEISEDGIQVDRNQSEFVKEIVLSDTSDLQVKFSDLPKVNFFGEGKMYLNKDDKKQYDVYLNEAIRLGLFNNTNIVLNYEDTYETLSESKVKRIDFMVAAGQVLLQLGANQRDVHVDYTPYKDWNAIPQNLRPYLSVYVLELGYGGDENKFLNPNRIITRAEAVTILARIMKWQESHLSQNEKLKKVLD